MRIRNSGIRVHGVHHVSRDGNYHYAHTGPCSKGRYHRPSITTCLDPEWPTFDGVCAWCAEPELADYFDRLTQRSS